MGRPWYGHVGRVYIIMNIKESVTILKLLDVVMGVYLKVMITNIINIYFYILIISTRASNNNIVIIYIYKGKHIKWTRQLREPLLTHRR